MDCNVNSLLNPKVYALAQVLGDPVETSTGELRFESPFSDKRDLKRHLYVNPEKEKFICFKSNTAGSLGYLCSLIGVQLKDAPTPSIAQGDNLEDLQKYLEDLDHTAGFVRPTADLPEWYAPVQAGSEVHRYLRGRNVSDEDIQYYELGEGLGEKSNWVVIPSRDAAGRCEYWVSRDVRRKAYLNPQVDRRYHVAFLHDALRHSIGEIVVCEGMFSAIAAGRDAVASLGKLVTQQQLQSIQQAGVRRVVLALDGDAWDSTLDVAKKCLRIGLEASILPLPTDQDPADLGREQFSWLRNNCTIPVNDADLLKLQLLTV